MVGRSLGASARKRDGRPTPRRNQMAEGAAQPSSTTFWHRGQRCHWDGVRTRPKTGNTKITSWGQVHTKSYQGAGWSTAIRRLGSAGMADAGLRASGWWRTKAAGTYAGARDGGEVGPRHGLHDYVDTLPMCHRRMKLGGCGWNGHWKL